MQGSFTTIEQHILEQQKAHNPDAGGVLTNLLYDVALAAKVIAREVSRAGLLSDLILGEAGETNTSGDAVKKLDLYADKVMFRTCAHTGRLCVMGSEEQDDIIEIPAEYPCGEYVLQFDPLDGSSNIDANVSIGTIFGIHRKISTGPRGTLEDCLQPGTALVAAGYVIYGSSTMLVYSTGHGVHGFTLDPALGEFLLSHPDIQTPERGKIFSVNEQYSVEWEPRVRDFVQWLKENDPDTARPRRARYIGSLVADFHRNMLYGGMFLYPGTVKKPGGKLRLLYECSPLAFLQEQAGGIATNGLGKRILEIQPTELHMRTPLLIGSALDVREAEARMLG